MHWPNDADGDVFRRLESNGFDFDVPCEIDFNVDFFSWPPHPEAIQILSNKYADLLIYEPSPENDGYLLFKLHDFATYELVTHVQNEVSALLSPFGGRCDSWGILHG